MTMFAAIAAFERKIMLERQREGIALAKAQGKYRGRKEAKKPANWQELIKNINAGRFLRSASWLEYVVVQDLWYINGSKVQAYI